MPVDLMAPGAPWSPPRPPPQLFLGPGYYPWEEDPYEAVRWPWPMALELNDIPTCQAEVDFGSMLREGGGGENPGFVWQPLERFTVECTCGNCPKFDDPHELAAVPWRP